MRIEYVLSCEDYVAFSLYLRQKRAERSRNSRWYWPAVGLGWLIGVAAGFAFWFTVWKGLLFWALPLVPDDNRIFASLAGVMTVLWLASMACSPPWEGRSKYAGVKRVRRRARSDHRKGRNYAGYSCEVVLGAEEIALTGRREWGENGRRWSHRYEYRVAWGEVASVDEFDMHAFVMTKNSLAIFIPKAAFPDGLAFRAFFEAARRLWVGAPVTALTALRTPAPARAGIQVRPDR
jgi:hypothetical protein